MFNDYGELSTLFYDYTKPVGFSIDGDIEYYYEKLKNIQGPILEAGVGTGRILIPFIKKGMKLEGVDLSDSMLKLCEKNMKNHQVRGKLYKQDLSNLVLPQTYDGIIMPTGSFCLLPRENIQKVLGGFYSHLNIGGKLMVDLEIPSHFKEGKVEARTIFLNENEKIVLATTNGKIDWMAQKTSAVNKYDLVEKGRVKKTQMEKFILYWYGIEEFEMRLAQAGYKNIEYEIGYGTNQSSLITFTAYKTVEKHRV